MAMTTRGFQVLALVAAAGAGFGLARRTAPAMLPEQAHPGLERLEDEVQALRRELAATPRPMPSSGAALDVVALREDLRRMVREELQSAKDSGPATASRERMAPAPPASQENLEALAKARRLMDESVSARRWGDREREEFFALRGRLTAQQTVQVLQPLVMAINSQQLRVSTSGPPF
ncbi:hypothetical protein [Corallococcus aberystwythensis]|uniref:Uncharacterized protein n=1 Tax=Corallococcus aberystwythensis TaxID=2316722 RepID=A0A3A8QE95_9BACT|nr:hypothetical protein [Corallococcus aberystwythensis]RKH67013.1 hypothetical protein D7W81_14530 [Corallococcus aberystwythensis]